MSDANAYTVFAVSLVVAILLAFAAVVIVVRWMIHRNIVRLMGEFAERFPHQCFYCSYYRHVMLCKPPEHDCREWTAEP